MTTEPTQARRHWFQFRLRTLLVMMLVVSLGMGWVMKERRRIAERNDAFIADGWTWETPSSQPEWHRMIFGEDEVAFSSKFLPAGEVTEEGLVHLAGLAQLKCLWLDNTQITDVGLVHLKGLTQLRDLSLHNTQITDAGLVHLTGLTQLQRLSLDSTRITDSGLVHLTGLTQMQRLWLGDNQITDAGLVHLTGLTQLQELWLGSTQVTDSGFAKIRKSLPNCRINQ